MAFVSLILAYIVVLVIILVILFFIGLALLIIGIVRKHKTKNKGKKSPVVCIVIGSVILAMPVVTAIIVPISVTSATFSELGKPDSYDNVIDKWNNEYVSDHTAGDDAINQLLTAADAGDREKFASTFTQSLRNSEDFDEKLNAFFELYPVGLSQCELDDTISSDGSVNYGERVENVHAYYTCMLDGEWYYIGMSVCYVNTEFPDEVGVNYFYIENLEAYAVSDERSDEDYLYCIIKSEGEVTARLIGGNSFAFTPTPDRVITEEQMREYLSRHTSLSSLADEIGPPNVEKKYSNCTGYDYYYELADENGEPRYAYICTKSSYGDFLYGYVCSDTQWFYDDEFFSED